MKEFHIGDLVSFDIIPMKGMGRVIKTSPESVDVLTTIIDWREDYYGNTPPSGDEPYTLSNVPYDILEKIDDDRWDDNTRLKYVESMLKSESFLEELPDYEKERIRKHLEVLCSHNNINALMKKGYLCYGGSPLYECDWDETVRCYEKVLESGYNSGVANSLGYIFYYGRTNNGVPDYDKAYRYFSSAALLGNHESLYKVGDMFLSGRGVPVIPAVADKLYERVYDETLSLVLDRNPFNKFADAALRMARSYERKGCPKSDIYGKYLEADLGLKIREKYHYYGDSTVRKAVDKGLEKYREENLESEERGISSLLDVPCSPATILHVILSRKGNNLKGSVSVVSYVSRKKSGDAYCLLTIPELSYCGFVRSFSFKCKIFESTPVIRDGDSLSFYTHCLYGEDNEVTFINEGESVSILGCSWKIMKPGKKDEFTPHWLEEEDF